MTAQPTPVAVEPFVLTNVLFAVDADDFAAHVSKVELVPTTPTVAWKGLAPAGSFNSSGQSSWVANVDMAQDWTTPGSLARYCFAHQGEKRTVTFQPQAGDGQPAWTVELTLVPPSIGGAVDTVAVSSIAMQVSGQPVPDWDNDPATANPAE